ncbi:acetyl-CoA decarbonylase/synthase complex subunit gamma [Candidatus Poribacteria bacterium]|nr:acetyl-CoA decarbonylase/synthase complex subunit gamma [Candidatus Poribacteria bacterium]
MAVSGIEIFKQLPKTNCKDCGFATCLAFAMSLAQGKTELSLCPHVSDEATESLSAASEPPIRTVTVGAGDAAAKAGGETVAFRHEKTFVSPTPIAILVTDAMDDDEVGARLAKMDDLQYDRVGLTLAADLVAVKETGGDPAAFAALAARVSEAGYGVILMSSDEACLSAALDGCAAAKPLIYAADADNVDAVGALAQTYACPVVARGSGLEEVAAVTEKLGAMDLKDIVIDSGANNLGAALADQVRIRRGALSGAAKPLGFPTIALPFEMTDDPMQEAVIASALIAKYAGIVVLSDFDGATLFPLLLERLSIFTDPQRPMATDEGIYEVGGPGEESPVIITANFSLSYFIVSGEIESSRVPSYLLVKDTEGLSVMTAWAAGKFVPDEIGPFVKKCGIEEKVSHRKLVIPGYAAQIAGELEDELPDWEIVVGPREASQLPAFLRSFEA